MSMLSAMVSWLLRGVVMTAVHVVARVLLGIAVVQSPLHSTAWRTIAVAAVVFIALVWGGFDGIRDARAHPDPDDYDDLTIRWLKAGVFAGLVSCLICWILGTIGVQGISESSFFIEIIAGGSFIALLIFFPAFIGASLGRWLTRRDQRKEQRRLDDESNRVDDSRDDDTAVIERTDDRTVAKSGADPA